MKIFKLVFLIAIVACIGGFTYIAVTDIPMEEKEITTTIPNERFFKD